MIFTYFRLAWIECQKEVNPVAEQMTIVMLLWKGWSLFANCKDEKFWLSFWCFGKSRLIPLKYVGDINVIILNAFAKYKLPTISCSFLWIDIQYVVLAVSVFPSRYRTYLDSTMPIIEKYSKKGMVKRVDGTKSPEEVFSEVKKIFSEL